VQPEREPRLDRGWRASASHQDVLGEPNTGEALVRTLHPLDGAVVAVPNDHHEVHVAVIVRLAPGVRTEQPNLFGMKFLGEPPSGFSKQIQADGFHGLNAIIAGGLL